MRFDDSGLDSEERAKCYFASELQEAQKSSKAGHIQLGNEAF